MSPRQRGVAQALLAGLFAALAMPTGAQETTAAIALPAAAVTGQVAVEDTLQRRRSVRSFAARPLALADVAQVLWAAQGSTSAGGRRTVPSAGALYPIELSLVAGQVDGLAPGLYRYEPVSHTLIRQRAGDLRAGIAAAAGGQAWLGTAPALLAITAVPERSARRYGARALRYVHIEAGHVSQSVYLQATARDLGTTFVGAFDDARLAQALELPAGQLPLGLMPFGFAR